MFEGTRLQYIVPGYTGHIPKNHFEQQGGYYQEEKPENHIPGYAGKIKSMKAENIFGKTYGKITYQIQHEDYYQGQDVPPELRYKSHLQDTFQNQNNVQLRTAAEIVGVKTRTYEYQIVKNTNNIFFNKQPQTETAKNFFVVDEKGNPRLKETLTQFQSQQHDQGETFEKSQQKFYGDNGGKEPLRLGTPLPGYTGAQKRVVAANIFGQTFANARKSAIDDNQKIQEERKNNFKTQANLVPALKR